MDQSKETGVASQSHRATGSAGGRGGDGTPQNMPSSLPRKGHVVWIHLHSEYLGYACDETEGEIKRAHVTDPEHAIYFETFAQAMVATDRLMSPYVILHSPERGEKPRLVR